MRIFGACWHNGSQEPSGGSFCAFLGLAGKMGLRRLLGAHLGHFWGVLAKCFSGSAGKRESCCIWKTKTDEKLNVRHYGTFPRTPKGSRVHGGAFGILTVCFVGILLLAVKRAFILCEFSQDPERLPCARGAYRYPDRVFCVCLVNEPKGSVHFV